jgi:diaminopimelate epimerase
VAAVVTGRHDPETMLPVRLPGGVLAIEVEAELARVWMEGPAAEVFGGVLELDAPMAASGAPPATDTPAPPPR